MQERLGVLAAECASALLTFSFAHSCNPSEAFVSVGVFSDGDKFFFYTTPKISILPQGMLIF